MRALLLIFSLAGAATAQKSVAPQTQDAAQPDLKPEDKCVIEGNVYNSLTGEPLKKAEIVLSLQDRAMQPLTAAITDAAGHYSIDDVAPGRYHVMARRNGFVDTRRSMSAAAGSLLTLGKGQHVTDVNFRLIPQGVVTGRVLDEDDEPMGNVNVSLLRRTYQNGAKTLQAVDSSASDDRGEYRIHGISPGRYYVLAVYNPMRFQQEPVIMKEDKGGYVPVYYPNSPGKFAGASEITVAAGAETNGVDFRLTRVHTVRVEGKVTNLPASGRSVVTLGPLDGSEGLGWTVRRRQFADTRGHFAFTDIMPGAYLLMAQAGSQESYLAAVSGIDVGQTNATGIVLALGTLPGITGTVSTEGLDTSHFGLRVALRPLVPQPGMFFGGPAEVQQDGAFRIDSVQPGRYRLTMPGLPADWYVKSVRLGQSEVADGIVDFSRGAAGELNIVISGRAGEIDGQVLKKEAAAPGATVVLVPDQRDTYNLFQSTVADMNGSFTIKGIAPGNYKLFAWDQVEYNAWTDPEFLQPFEDAGQAVVVRESDKLTKNPQLIVTADKR
ncbi:MAG TPA: carboxypeptidase regulatory-like domain-containing protein [Bryobacteraceae bacterium]|nr:carboxypeptidase regulatory-like domain-containing protein [Bryobacteraceae bacterium]